MYCYRVPGKETFLALAEAQSLVTTDKEGKKLLPQTVTNTH